MSRDRGATWKRFPLSDPETGFCEALACGPAGSAVIYAGGQAGDRGVIYRTDDLGISWNRTASAPGADIVSLAVHPQDPGTVLAAAGRLYRSTDAGESWAECPAGRNLVSVRFNPHQPAMIAAGGDSGVVLSLDAGATWSRLDAGLEDRHVSYLAFADSGRWLVCATRGRACFAWPLAAGVAERPLVAEMDGPARLAPTIGPGRFAVSWTGRVTGISVYDAAGRAVFRQSSIDNLGSSMALDLRGLSAGVYLVRLDAGGFTQSQKLVVER